MHRLEVGKSPKETSREPEWSICGEIATRRQAAPNPPTFRANPAALLAVVRLLSHQGCGGVPRPLSILPLVVTTGLTTFVIPQQPPSPPTPALQSCSPNSFALVPHRALPATVAPPVLLVLLVPPVPSGVRPQSLQTWLMISCTAITLDVSPWAKRCSAAYSIKSKRRRSPVRAVPRNQRISIIEITS